MYDYRNGKNRIVEICKNNLDVVEKNKLPRDDSFTFKNAYYSWVTAIFVDIRDSSDLFTSEEKEEIAKIIRSFTSEIIEILRDNELLREIGIRGDCVFAIYTTPLKSDIHKLADFTFYINTFMKMLNKILEDYELPNVKVGIGISTSQELVVKAGRKDTGINNKVWIGDAVTKASNFSSLGNRNGNQSIIFSTCTYENIIDILVKDNGELARDWFNKKHSTKYGHYYEANIIKTNFDNWIKEGMKD